MNMCRIWDMEYGHVGMHLDLMIDGRKFCIFLLFLKNVYNSIVQARVTSLRLHFLTTIQTEISSIFKVYFLCISHVI